MPSVVNGFVQISIVDNNDTCADMMVWDSTSFHAGNIAFSVIS